MLLNEFLKEHRTVQELKSVVAKQEAATAQQQKQIEALAEGLQKVSAQPEVSKPAPQTLRTTTKGSDLKYWEIIADNLSKAGWSWGCVSATDLEARTMLDC